MTHKYACCNNDKSCSSSAIFGSFFFWPSHFICDGKRQCHQGAFGSRPFVYSCTCSTVPDPSEICPSTDPTTEPCPAGHNILNGKCLVCKKDKWSSEGATSCSKCPCTQTTGDKPGTKKEDCKPRTPNPNNNKCSEEVTKTYNEGFCPRCYLDTAKPGHPTIGYGFNLDRVDAKDVLKKYGLTLEDVTNDCTSKFCLDLEVTPPKPRAAEESDMPLQLHGETTERPKHKHPPKTCRKPAAKLCLGKDSSGCKYCKKYPRRCLDKTDASKIFDEDYQKE